MRKFYALLIMVLFGSSLFQVRAQEMTFSDPDSLSAEKTKSPKWFSLDTEAFQQFYLGFGAGITKTNASNLEKQGNIFFSYLNLSFNKSTFFRGGYSYTRFNENLEQHPDINSKGYISPLHEITSYYLNVGKRKQLGSSFMIQATAGISYNRYTQPVNIRTRPRYGPFLGTSNILDFEKIRKDKLGFIVQAEIIGGRRLSWSGITLGSFYHYIPESAQGGLTLAFNLGLISRE